MVNEANKPHESLENEQLGQRLAASNQALASMQAEHRQLLEEMEQLRKRAETLQRIRDRTNEEEKKHLESQQNVLAQEETQPREESDKICKNSEEQEEKETPDPNEADYIKDKLNEIARLKAQFKRVQHMINTTELIENHISKNQADGSLLDDDESTKPVAKTENEVIPKTIATVHMPVAAPVDPDLLSVPKMPSMADLNAATTSDEKEQLILTMLNMFQDFSSDLKSQADNLRAERERIKELKESIIRSRKEQNK